MTPILIAACVVATAWSSAASAATDPPEQDPDATVATVDPAAATTTTTTIPAGCERPDDATAVFVGEVTAKDSRTARFEVVQVRAGNLKGYEVTGLVDVDYYDDVKYLDVGEQYVVGAEASTITRRLKSTVRAPAPLFGGNQVVGVNDSDVDCPVFEDPVRTLLLDGSSVESGVFAPLAADKAGLARALLMPALWLFLGLVALAAIKDLLWASAREIRQVMRRRDPLREPAPRRTRAHRTPPPGRAAPEN